VDFAEDETAAVANNRQKVELQHRDFFINSISIPESSVSIFFNLCTTMTKHQLAKWKKSNKMLVQWHVQG
jgi:hypothetical protein